jgi:hypothetical protein
MDACGSVGIARLKIDRIGIFFPTPALLEISPHPIQIEIAHFRAWIKYE